MNQVKRSRLVCAIVACLFGCGGGERSPVRRSPRRKAPSAASSSINRKRSSPARRSGAQRRHQQLGRGTSDTSGTIPVIHLQPGEYNVDVTLAGFAPYKQRQRRRRGRTDHEPRRRARRRRPDRDGHRHGGGAGHQHRAGGLLHQHQPDDDCEPSDQHAPLVDLRPDDARRGAGRQLRPGQLPRHLRAAEQQHRGRRRQHAGVLRRRARPHASRATR